MSTPSHHSILEDAQALLLAPLFCAFAIVLFQKAGLLTGGTIGIAFLLHYLSGWPMGWLVFAVNLPFYVLGWRVLGWRFTLKTFIAVTLVSLYTEWLPQWIGLEPFNQPFAAIMAGAFAGVGILILIRHKASLGGLGILVLHLQNTRGWSAGKVQMAADVTILVAALFVRDPWSVGFSIFGALAMNMVIAVNHKAGRYMGI